MTKQQFKKWLKEQRTTLEQFQEFGEPHEVYYLETELEGIVDTARRLACRYGADPGPCGNSLHSVLAYIGGLLDQTPADTLLTVADVATRLKVNQGKVLGWIAYGRLKAINTAKSSLTRPRWRIRPSDLDDFLAGRTGRA